MEVIHNVENRDFKEPLGIALGNFDGLHIGHTVLINILVNECRLNGLYSMVHTFLKHPGNILKKESFTPVLTTTVKKAEILGNLSVDYLFYENFNESFSKMKPEGFVKDVLIDRFHVRLAVAGFNYTFGYKGGGDARLLMELGKKYNFKVIIVPPIKIGNNTVSSTLIREHLIKGNMEEIYFMLGRYYSITDIVKEGHGVGKELGFPTANIKPKKYLLIPPCGVYKTRTFVDGRIYKSITNVGRAPTIKNINEDINVETHILDFNEKIYGKKIEIFFITKIRDEKKFKERDELIQQIRSDILKINSN